MDRFFGLLMMTLTPLAATAGPHPFNAHDLVMMDRVSDPQLSPDETHAAFTVRTNDLAANKGVTSVWLLDLHRAKTEPQKLAAGHSPRWAMDGKTLYFLSDESGSSQLWRVTVGGGTPQQVSELSLAINNYRLAPDGRHVLLSLDVFDDCKDLACTKARLDAQAVSPSRETIENHTTLPGKPSGRLYSQLFVRHWDAWKDGRRSQLFIASIGDNGKLTGEPLWLTRGLDGDIPSKPDGDDNEYSFSPDGNTVYFNARVVGASEAWSTNFDIYAVPADGSARPENLTATNPAWDGFPLASPDGHTLYYLAMKVPGFERDRFAIMARDLRSGSTRELAPHWNFSAGPLQISVDGRTLYTTADDDGRHALFSINTHSGEVAKFTHDGTVTGFAVGAKQLLLAHQDFKHPTDLYVAKLDGSNQRAVTHFNAAQLANIRFGDWQWFDFKGWNDDSVHGYVVKPVDYVAGKKYPVAFLIHGGPQGAWNEDFHYRWNPEVYAGAGFAVVAINFHGSTGYGQAFTNAISKHWGDRPLEDLQKGWDAALAQFPFLDANRACALGASYGGYMVYWMAGVWNQPWKCLVDHDGVFDTRMGYYATEELWFEEHEHGAAQYAAPESYEKFNPLNHVKDWRVPMLVIHSELDYRIPVTQGLGAFTALQRRGIPSEFLYFPDENHWVNKPQNSLQWHATVLAWLKRWTS